MTQLYHWVFTQKAPSQQATDASYQGLQQRCSQQVSFGTSVVCDKCLFTNDQSNNPTQIQLAYTMSTVAALDMKFSFQHG
jgi:predicted kinase